MEPWQQKAHNRIQELCRSSYLEANILPCGKLRKRHKPYSVPAEARALVECLGTDNESRAKSIFVHGWCDFTSV